MADKEYLLGNRARELLKYTNQVTKVVTDDVSQKVSTAQYEANALVCTAKLSAILSKKVYTPSKFEIFRVYEPKERLVQAPAFVDKVVLHAVVDNILYDAICKSFIRDNFASQKQKGTHEDRKSVV